MSDAHKGDGSGVYPLRLEAGPDPFDFLSAQLDDGTVRRRQPARGQWQGPLQSQGRSQSTPRQPKAPPMTSPSDNTLVARLRGRLVSDLLWAAMMFRVRRHRRALGFSQRITFDNAFRPKVDRGVIAYPDATYHAGPADFRRAHTALKDSPK